MADETGTGDRRGVVADLATRALEGDRELTAEAVAAVGAALSAPVAAFEPGPEGPELLAGESFEGASALAGRALAGEDAVTDGEGIAAVVGPAADPLGVVCVGDGALSEDDRAFVEEVTTLLGRARERGRFRQFAEHLEEVVWMSSVEIDEIHYVNPAYEEVWGRSRESLYADPTSFLEGVHPEDRERVEEAIPERARGEYEEVYRVVRPDDTIRWVRDRAYPIREGGKVRQIVGIAEDVTDRWEQKRRLEAINRLNRLCQDVTHLVITTPDRTVLEQGVCDRLAEAYRFVWVGEIESGGSRVVSRVWAGHEEGYLDAVRITADGADTASGPTGRAIDTGEVGVVSDIATDPDFEPWREEAIERGYRSSAAIPIAHQGLLYGIVNVYAARPDAFSDPELEALSRLGTVIGHAIAAVERKEALEGDTVLELEFRVEGVFEELVACSAETGGSIRFDHFVPRAETVVAYGSASGVPKDRFRAAAADEEWIESIRLLADEDDDYEFELRTTDSFDLAETLAAHAGRLTSATISCGGVRFVVGLAPGSDVRGVVDAIESRNPSVSYVAKRTITSERAGITEYDDLLTRRLTERQREVLETATYAGYFEWPRSTTGEEVAEGLGISPATFAQHLRAAQRKLFEAMFDRN